MMNWPANARATPRGFGGRWRGRSDPAGRKISSRRLVLAGSLPGNLLRDVFWQRSIARSTPLSLLHRPESLTGGVHCPPIVIATSPRVTYWRGVHSAARLNCPPATSLLVGWLRHVLTGKSKPAPSTIIENPDPIQLTRLVFKSCKGDISWTVLKQKVPRSNCCAGLFVFQKIKLGPALALAQISDHRNFHCLALISLVGEIQLVKPDQDANAKAGCNDSNNP